jgi:hypothetical protein
MSFVAGHYSATWNGTSIGTTERGFRLQMNNHHETVMIDDHGDAMRDAIQRGVDYRLTLEYVEYDLIKPVVASQAGTFGTMSKVGYTLAALSKQLVLTATAGTSAALAGNIATLTAPRAIILSDTEILLANNLRKGPLTFLLLPDASGVHFTVT